MDGRRWKRCFHCPDVCTGGTATVSKRITPVLEEGTFYPSHDAIDHYHRFKEDIALFANGIQNVSFLNCMD